MAEVYQSELSLTNRLGRLLWGIASLCLFRPSPRVFHRWRVAVLKLFGATIEGEVKVYPTARIWAPWNLTLESGVILGDRVDCYSVAPIRIKEKAVISQDSCLCAATHDHRSADFTLLPKPIVVGEGAWVAARAFVGPGVSVGDRAVVGACAVVFRDVAPGTVVVGNPAQVQREKSLPSDAS